MDETAAATTIPIGTALGLEDVTLPMASIPMVGMNTYVQVDAEVICINEPTKDGEARWIDRGVGGTTIAPHSAGVVATVLERNLHTVPLGAHFFGDPTHTDYQYRLLFPNRRVAATEFYLSNTKGTGPALTECFLTNGQNGLRTFEGGTLILQVAGALSIERDAVSSITTDRTRIVRDIQAFVDSAPSGGNVGVLVKAGDNALATLTIPSGQTQAAAYVPSQMIALSEGTKVNFDIIDIPQGPNTFPGRNLSVQIRT